MDPFEDVRQLAASVLELCSNLVHGFELPDNLTYQSNLEDTRDSDFSENDFLLFENYLTLGLTRAARVMQKTGRADHSDGFGRLCEFVAGQRCKFCAESLANKSLIRPLLLDLDCGTQLAGRSIYQAIESAPIPGYLTALRLTIVRENQLEASSELESISLVEYQDLVSQILRVCTSVWNSVKDVLCFDAPEGYEYDADEGNETMIGTKDILSYCWRALKESSLLLQAVITCKPKSKISRSLRHNDYKQIGELFLSELSQLRHRGAFSSVSLAFTACCVQCVRKGDISTRELPKEWFQEVLAFIKMRASALTRRSAGLPAMVTGILSAYVGGEFFDNVNLELRRIASQSIERAEDQSLLCLPQVHALNCLKDIFTDSKFSTSTEGHISKTLDIAVNCLDSDIWALRNSGLMLLKALVNRLNGGTDIASTKASSSRRQLSSFLYAKYENLPDLLMKLFNPRIHALLLIEKDKGTTFQVQRVFPALEIVERLGVPNQYEREIKHELWQHIEGPVWLIRDKAAKATSALCPERDIPVEVWRILDAPWSTQNSLHGRLLYVRHLSSRIGEAQSNTSNDVWGNLLSQLLKVFSGMLVSNRCPITRAAYLAVVAYVLEKLVGPMRHSSEIGTSGPAADSILSSLPSTTRRTIICIWQDFQEYLDIQKSSGSASPLEHEAIIRCSELIQQIPCSERLDSPSRQMGHHENGSIFMKPGNPANSDEALRQTGNFLAAQLSHTPCSAQVWGQDFLTRKAAIDSILNFISEYPCNEHTLTSTPKSLGLYMAVYDSLMDDDDEIRDQGAVAVSILLLRDKSIKQDGGLEESLSAPAARSKLLQYLIERYSTSMDLWTEAAYRIMGVNALVRLIGQKKETYSFLDSAQDSLKNVKWENTSLFIEEKQNLFIDEAQEAATWLNVLMNLKISKVDELLSVELLRWTAKGIKVLIEAAEMDVDGPLGWTSKPDTFILGMRFILTAQAITHFSDQSTLQDNVETLRKLLQRLLDVGRKRFFCLHPIWLSALQSALGVGPSF
ncbi:MAG: hypothetical protein Q9214_000398 [Letrouitia sp. 1 TL-2023]